MSQRSRLDLTDLASLRKPLVQTSMPEKESKRSGDLVPPQVSDTVQEAVPSEVPPRILLQRKDRKRLIAQSFKLPSDLDERWSTLAAFNKVTKTGILLEALETFLDRLPQPPAQEQE